MISKGIQFWYLYSALVALVLIRIIPFVYPDSRTWGFNHLIFLPSDYSVLFFCLAIVALLLPFVKKSEIWGGEFVDWFSNIFFESPRKYIYRVVLILSITALFIIFSAKTHFLGDGYEVINNISSGDGSFFKWSALGITFLLKILNQVLGADGNQTAILAIQIVSYLSGILSIWFYFLIAEYISEIKVQRIIMFLVLLFSGSLLLLFGYAENYPSLLIAVSGMIYGG
ncbi:MAG: hypothetical protein GY865_06525, partial [candidate division Zixibacteria bacterium]|nr:hypothetical protein [candidate division Zixibacteria bacterium]